MAIWNRNQKSRDETPDRAEKLAAPASGTEALPVSPPSEQDHKWLLPEKSRRYLEELFQSLQEDVVLLVFTQDGVNEPYNGFCTDFVSDLARISSKIKPQFASLDSESAQRHQVRRSPTILVQPESYRIRLPAHRPGKRARP